MIFAGNYGYSRLAADATRVILCKSLGGFLCDTSGTITVTALDNAGDTLLLDDFAVTAGNFYPIPIKVPEKGVRFESTDAAGLIVG